MKTTRMARQIARELMHTGKGLDAQQYEDHVAEVVQRGLDDAQAYMRHLCAAIAAEFHRGDIAECLRLLPLIGEEE